MTDAVLSDDSVPETDEMPMLGLGTWENDDPEQCTESVANALEMGYRHIDTAQVYGNEAAVGAGIEQADVDREEIFLATKVWIDSLAPEDVKQTTRESLDRLGVESVELLYVHWPARTYDPAATLGAFTELKEDGLIDRIGVSNFEPEQLAEAVEITDGDIFANQIELHPMLPQPEIREACAEHDVEPVAYSPLARGEVFDVPEISAVAEKHGVSEAQVSLAWLREKDVTTIPKATGTDHLADNLDSVELTLDEEDVAKIDEIDSRNRRVDPDFGPWN
jgi:2,5-diketo-D-gluconate reductase B